MLKHLMNEMREEAGLQDEAKGAPIDFLALIKGAEDDVKKYGPSKPDDPDGIEQAAATAKKMGFKKPAGRIRPDEIMLHKDTNGWKESATLAHRLVKAIGPKVTGDFVGPFRAMKPGANYGRWFWKPAKGKGQWITIVAQGDVPKAKHKAFSFVRLMVGDPSGHMSQWEKKNVDVPRTYVSPRQNPDGSNTGARGRFREDALDDLLVTLRESQE